MSSEAATKQDLADAVRQVTEKTSRDIADAVQQVTEITTRNLAGAVQQVTDKLTEAIRDSQTEVLRAFYDWSRPVDTRLRHADELVQRMGWLEERVSKIERGDLPSTH